MKDGLKMSGTASFTERELIDLALHFANGDFVQLSAVFTHAYLRDNPTLIKALDNGNEARFLAMEKMQAALNGFFGGEVVKIKDAVRDQGTA